MKMLLKKETEDRKIKAELLNNLRLLCNEREGITYVKKCYRNAQDGCLPDEYIGDELLNDIKNKYYYFFKTVAIMVEERFKVNISLIIESSYEDRTYVVGYITKEKYVILDYSCKAWNFGGFGKDLAEELMTQYNEMCNNYIIYRDVDYFKSNSLSEDISMYFDGIFHYPYYTRNCNRYIRSDNWAAVWEGKKPQANSIEEVKYFRQDFRNWCIQYGFIPVIV